MTIEFNGEVIAINEGNSLNDLLKVKQLDTKTGIAVAVNEHVIPKQEWQSVKLNLNDSIIVITATQGG